MQEILYIGMVNRVILKRENTNTGKIVGKKVHKILGILYHHEYNATY